MTSIALRRGQLRAALTALLPHAGRACEQTPDYGRLRFHVRGDDVLIWTTDGMTSAVARVSVDEHHDGDLDGWDMGVAEVRAVLAVLTRPGNADERSVWEEAECTVDLLARRVRFSETGDLFGGRDVAVARLEPPGGSLDTYPDVPAVLTQTMAGTPADVARAGVRMDLLARFATSAKAYEGSMALRFVADPPAVLVRLGRAFVGEVSARVAWESGGSADQAERDWHEDLLPLVRPALPQVPDAVADDLRDQAAELLKHGSGFLRVVRDGADS